MVVDLCVDDLDCTYGQWPVYWTGLWCTVRLNHTAIDLCNSMLPHSILLIYTGCAFSGRPLARSDWKCWWAIGKHFNGRPPGEWK